MLYKEFKAMNSDILLAGEGEIEAVETGFSEAQEFIEASEKRFTRFSENSELSLLNRSSGKWMAVSEDMFQLFVEALSLHDQTDGLFDPAILSSLEAAGYNSSIEEIRLHGANHNPNKENKGVITGVFSDILLDPDLKKIWMPKGLRIDFGGIAKSWIAEKAAGILSSWTNACAVDAGGDAFLIGLPAGQECWQVILEDPNAMDRCMAVLNCPPGAVATSTITKRHWLLDGKPQHHLIDPRTRRPAVTDWLSVTVLAKHATEAEVYAKCLLIGGSKEADRITGIVNRFEQPYDHSGVGVVFFAIDAHNAMWGSSYSRNYISTRLDQPALNHSLKAPSLSKTQNKN